MKIYVAEECAVKIISKKYANYPDAETPEKTEKSARGDMKRITRC